MWEGRRDDSTCPRLQYVSLSIFNWTTAIGGKPPPTLVCARLGYSVTRLLGYSAISQSSCHPPWVWPSCLDSHGSSSRNSSSKPHGGLAIARPEPVRVLGVSSGCTSNSTRNNFGAPVPARSW